MRLERKFERESLKRTISTSDGLELLQMILEPDTERCTSEEAECHGHARPRRVAHGRMPMTSPTLYVFSYSSVLLLYF